MNKKEIRRQIEKFQKIKPNKKQAEPLVSIVISYYDHLEYIESCIDSCYLQTYRNIEIIVVNDGSPDKGYVKVHQTDWKHRKVEDIGLILKAHSKNLGYAEAMNTGIKWSKGEFIVILDSDNMLTPDSIKVRVKAFRKKPALDIVYGLAYQIGKESYKKCLKGKFPKHGKYDNRVHDQTVMFRKSVFYKVGLFCDMGHKLSSTDKEMFYRLGIHPNSPLPRQVKSQMLEDYMVYYRVHSKSMKQSRDDKLKKELRKLFFNRIVRLIQEGLTRENTKWL